jgi:adenylylsulfate kinase-like enzyme
LFPFLWLSGTSGVGKSAVGWQIFSDVERSGVATAYVDADQLGLCYPAPRHDKHHHAVKARNLAAVWSTFQEAGARCLVLSGIVDAADQVRAYADAVPGADLTHCRLQVRPERLRERIERRGWQVELADEAIALAERLDRIDNADLRVDTDDLSVAQVARVVRERAGGWPRLAGGAMPAGGSRRAAPEAGPPPPGPAGDVEALPMLWLCGAPAAGKSTVGFDIFLQTVADGITTAYVDLSQIGFCRPAAPDDPDNHRIKARNLGALWAQFRAVGARCLIVTGRVNDRATVETYSAAVPGTTLRLCRLHADRDTLTARVLQRGRGIGPGIPGDELRNRSAASLDLFAEWAVRDADELERAGLGDLRIDTSRDPADEVARRIRAAVGGG